MGLFHKDIEPRCAYCAKGATVGEDKVLCKKKGMVSPGDHCGSFKYDPMKRTPPKPALLNTDKLSQEDFSLD